MSEPIDNSLAEQFEPAGAHPMMVDGLMIGQTLYGFCGGVFGRDCYEDKRVEVIGNDWVVVRGLESDVPFMARIRPRELLKYAQPDKQIEITKHCSVCSGVQFLTYHGWTCKNGHGGAPPAE